MRATPGALKEVASLFLRLGSTAFGGPAAHIAMMEDEVVRRRRWLSREEFLDLLGATHLIPGPNSTEMAIHIGRQRYLLGGTRGALVATLGIFLPAFVFVAVTAPLVPRLRRSPTAGAFLDGVNVASLALLVVVTWHLARVALVDLPSVALAAGAAVLLARFRVNSAWLVLGGSLVGLTAGGPS